MSRGNIYDYDTAGPKHAPYPTVGSAPATRKSIQRSDYKCTGVAVDGRFVACPGKRNSLLNVSPTLCEECLTTYAKNHFNLAAVLIRGKAVSGCDELEDLLYPEYCPECNTPLVLKKGWYGLFMACPTWPKCAGVGCAEPDLKQVTSVYGIKDEVFVTCGDWTKTFTRKDFFGGLDENDVLDEVAYIGTEYHKMKLTKASVDQIKKYALRTDGSGCWMIRIQNAEATFSPPQTEPVEKEEEMPVISPAHLIKKACNTGDGWCFTEENRDLPGINKDAWLSGHASLGRTAVLLPGGEWNCWGKDSLVHTRTSERQARDWVFYGSIIPTVGAPPVNKPPETPVTKQELPVPNLSQPSKGFPKEKKKTMKKTLDVMKLSVTVGAKTAAADEAGNVVLDIAKKLLGDKLPGLFDSEEGRSLAKFFIASGLHAGADVVAPDSKQSEALQTACAFVMEAASRDVIQPNLALLRPMLLELVNIGQGKVTL